MCRAFSVPSSGTLTWKSERISRRNASNSESDLSTSSIKRTDGSGDVMAFSSGRGSRKRALKKTSSSFPIRSTASVSDFAAPTTSLILSFKIWVYRSCFAYSHS
jgi:hypothetical protein